MVIRLTTADIDDLAQGSGINVPDGGASGQEINLYGEDFDESDITALRSGRTTTVNGFEFQWDEAPGEMDTRAQASAR